MLKKEKKTGKIVIAAALIVILLLGLVWHNMAKKSAEAQNRLSQFQTDTVTKRPLTKSVGATGTIVSAQSKELSVALSDIEVNQVNVEVGNSVKEGDPLVVFDTSDIEENLTDAKNTLSKAERQNSLSASDAQRNVEDAERTKDYQIDSAKTNIDTSYRDYQNAVSGYNDAISQLEDLKSEEKTAKDKCQKAKDAQKTAEKALEQARKKAAETEKALKEAKQKYEALASSQTDETTIAERKAVMDSAEQANTDAQQSYTAAQESYNTALSNVTNTENAYNSAKSSRKAQESTVESSRQQAESQQSAYDTSVKTYQNTVAAQESSVASAKSSQSSTSLNLSTDNEKQQVELYEEQLEEGVLKAPFSGIITAVNYNVGDTYTQGAIVTVQDCSSYEVEAEIGEYDISDIKMGQTVLIKTQATGDEELQGTVTFVSPTATQNEMNNEMNSDVTYRVEISIDTENDRLRLDMSASLSIIVEQHEDVLTVPYNAVQTDEEGSSFIQEISEDGKTTTDIPVTIIMESNYYTEIESKELYEGMEVIVQNSGEESSDFDFMPPQRGGF